MVGTDPMGAAIRAAVTRYRLQVETCGLADVSTSVLAAAPDLALLIGDAAASGGQDVLRLLGLNPATSVVPIAILTDDASLDDKLKAFRYGAVAVVQRSASADAIGKRVAELAKELPDRQGEATGEIGEATLDEFVDLLKRELRSGILSVGNEGDEDAVRLVLGAGRPVADALKDFVDKLKPLVAKAEPLKYELLEESGGRLQLLEPSGLLELPKEDPSILAGVRILVMDSDPGRADALAQELRNHAAKVGVTEVSERGLEKARALEPEVLIIDGADIEGPAFQLVRNLRKDVRLRWSSMLIVSWDELWPHADGGPDLPLLTAKIAPLISQDLELKVRAEREEQFDTRLEATGPSRLIRALGKAKRTLHVTVVSNKATIEVDLSQGLLVGAVGQLNAEAEGLQEPRGQQEESKEQKAREVAAAEAVASLLSMSSGRVRVEHRMNPRVANVMTPVDEALAAAWAEGSPLAPSIPPSDPPTAPPPPMPEEFGDLPTLESESPPPAVQKPREPQKPQKPPVGAGPTPARGVSRAAARTMMGIGAIPMSPPPRISVREEMLDRLTPRIPLPELPGEAVPVPVVSRPQTPTPMATREDVASLVADELEMLSGDLETVRPPPSLVPEELGDVPASPDPVRGDPTMVDPPGVGSTEAAPPPGPSAGASGVGTAPNRDISTERPEESPGGRTNTVALVFLLLSLVVGAAVAVWIFVPEAREALGYPDAVAVTGEPLGAGAATDGVPEDLVGVADASVAAAAADGGTGLAAAADGGAAGLAGDASAAAVGDGSVALTADAAAPADPGTAPDDQDDPPDEDPPPAVATGVDPSRSAGSLIAEGERLIRRGELAEAGPLLERAYELDPDDNHVLAGLARVYISQGNGPRAVEMAEAACRKRARRTSYRLLLGEAQELNGNVEGARAAYGRVIAQEPNNGTALRRLEALRQ